MSAAPDPLREVDCLLAQHVLNYEMQIVNPDWYPHEVRCFIWRDSKSPLMAYSYDQNACNASMFANGKDEKDGYAQPLPRWSGEDSEGYEWEVVNAMLSRGRHLWLTSLPGIYRISYQCTFFDNAHTVVQEAELADWPQAAIALAALKAVGADISPFHDAVRPSNPT